MLDSVLGEVEERDDGLVCRLLAGEELVKLTIRLEGATRAEGIAVAHKLAPMLLTKLQRAREELVSSILPMVNDGYRNPGEEPVTTAEFIRRATLAGVSTDADGNLSLTFDDDGMLWGHWMTVDTNLDGTSWDASMWG